MLLTIRLFKLVSRRSYPLRHCLVMLLCMGLFITNVVYAQEVLNAAQIAARAAGSDRIPSWRAQVVIEDYSGDTLKRSREGQLATRENSNDTAQADGAQRYYRFTSPQDIRGTSLLIHEHPGNQDDLWLYLPYLGKSRRIAGSAKRNSFVGTQYSFSDLTSFEYQRYQHQLLAEETCAESECWVLESTPKEADYAKEIGYSKLRSWVNQRHCRIVKVEYYDAAGALLKTQSLADFTQAGGDKSLALNRRMVNHRKGQSSVIRFSAPDFTAQFSDEDFSALSLGKN